MFYISVSVCL